MDDWKTTTFTFGFRPIVRCYVIFREGLYIPTGMNPLEIGYLD